MTEQSLLVGLATAEKQDALAEAIALLGTEAKLELIRQLLAGPLSVTGPLTDAQLGARLLATAAGQTTSNSLLTAIKTSLEASVDLATTMWTDDSGAFYVRRDVIDQDAGTVAVSFTTPTGSAATPGAGLRPAANEESLTPITQLYNVGTTNAPGGYTLGDVVARHVVMNENTAPPSVVAATWLNLTTGAVIAAPTAGHIILAQSAASTGAATDAKLELVRLLLAGVLTVAPSTDQDPIFNDTAAIKIATGASAVVFTPPAGCKFARFDASVDTFIRTDDAVAADASGSTRLIAGQPEVVPVTAALAVRAYSATAGVLRVTPLKVR